MSSTSTAPSLDELLAGAQLPALPQSAVRLLELSQDPDNGPAEFAAPIECDPGLTGQVLRFVNSSYFGFSREISSIKLAITLVGIKTIKNFALWNAVFTLMPNPKCGPFDLKVLWQDSLRRGLFARAMGGLLGAKEAEELFAISLLQDMAIPLLAQELPEQYNKLLDQRQGGLQRLSDLEQETFGWNHAEAAGIMARSWSLPDQFAVLVQNHTKLEEQLVADQRENLKVAISLSSMLPTVLDEVWYERDTFIQAYDLFAGDGHCGLEQILTRIDAEFAEFSPVLKVSVPDQSLVDWLSHDVEQGER